MSFYPFFLLQGCVCVCVFVCVCVCDYLYKEMSMEKKSERSTASKKWFNFVIIRLFTLFFFFLLISIEAQKIRKESCGILSLHSIVTMQFNEEKTKDITLINKTI